MLVQAEVRRWCLALTSGGGEQEGALGEPEFTSEEEGVEEEEVEEEDD